MRDSDSTNLVARQARRTLALRSWHTPMARRASAQRQRRWSARSDLDGAQPSHGSGTCLHSVAHTVSAIRSTAGSSQRPRSGDTSDPCGTVTTECLSSGEPSASASLCAEASSRHAPWAAGPTPYSSLSHHQSQVGRNAVRWTSRGAACSLDSTGTWQSIVRVPVQHGATPKTAARTHSGTPLPTLPPPRAAVATTNFLKSNKNNKKIRRRSIPPGRQHAQPDAFEQGPAEAGLEERLELLRHVLPDAGLEAACVPTPSGGAAELVGRRGPAGVGRGGDQPSLGGRGPCCGMRES
jgi:hypothetical protein